MHKHVAALVTLGAFTLAACGSKTDANEKNFGKAMDQYFDKKGDLCLHTNDWPVDVSEFDLRMEKAMRGGKARQMAVLEKAGLVKGEDVEVDQKDMFGKPSGTKFKVKRYTLTEAAKPFTKETDARSIGLNGTTTVKRTDICWGKKALDKVVKWEGPMKFGDYQEAGITYTYKVDKLADWAKGAEVQAVFPHIKNVLDAAGKHEDKHGVKLTSEGWEAKGLDS